MTPNESFDHDLALMTKTGLGGQSTEKRTVTVSGHQDFTHVISAMTPDGQPLKNATLHVVHGTVGRGVMIGACPEVGVL